MNGFTNLPLWSTLRRQTWGRRVLYEALGAALRDAAGGYTLNCGWAEGSPGLPTGLALYREAARWGALRGPSPLLEAGCGLGGGTAWLARTLAAPRTVGVDASCLMIRACRRLHRERGLDFRSADARRLPFASASFDAAVSVEMSHCLEDKAAWLAEVARVTRPGGRLVWLDFFYKRNDSPNALARREAATRAVSTWWHVQADEDRTQQARRALEVDSLRRERLIARDVPVPLRAFAREFAGTTCSSLYLGLAEGRTEYRWALLERTEAILEEAPSI